MINLLIQFSVKNKIIILLLTASMIVFGIYSAMNIPIGAVPDITNNQVQVITTSRNLSTLDVEQFITYPVELEMANLPGVKEIRSISKFGLSVVTIVFDDNMGTYLPRQLIAEKIKSASEKIPERYGSPKMGPISTGLGEIYKYTLEVKPEFIDQYSVMELRTIQDWLVRRQLAGVKGVVEVNTWGGFLKQYEVAVDPEKLKSHQISLQQVFVALQNNNQNAGGGYIEKTTESYFIRGEGMISSMDDIKNIVVNNENGVPLLIKHVAEVKYGHAVRFGAITGNGEGEKVMGQIMMLKDANSFEVIEAVKTRMAKIEKTLPDGVYINDFLERTELINKTTSTVTENLVLGALIVIFVLVILMGDTRAGIIVASVIPLAMLFGLSIMYVFGVDVNLMSLGAIDFGILVDGAVIIVEFIVLQIYQQQARLKLLKGQQLQHEKDQIAINGSSRMMRSAIFGQIIILIVFIPILSLSGIEGKMFRPMALSFSFILIGAMILCLTYVPAIAALFLKPPKKEKKTVADRIMNFLQKLYTPSIKYALDHRKVVISSSVFLLAITVFVFFRLGGEFVPTLDEGDYVVQPVLRPGTSLSETIAINTKIEKILLEKFPEVEQVVSRIGAAEVPTDPMSMEMSDIIVILKDQEEWVSADTKDELADKMKEAMSAIPGIEYEFTQPIEMRFNELITGVRADVAIKIYGEDLDILFSKGNEIKNLASQVPGASDVLVEQITGLPQVAIRYQRERMAQYGLQISDLNNVVQMAYAGVTAGNVFEGEKRFDLVIRMEEKYRQNLNSISNLYVELPKGGQIPIREVADIEIKAGPAQISRDDTRRRIVVSVNVRNRDMESVVEDMQALIEKNVSLPDGYSIDYGGQFENLRSAKERLLIAVPVALLLIFILLFFTFGSIKQALLIFTAIPLSAVGGVFSLWIRGLPFSISAGVGFIALFGIAVLNGIILISFFNELKHNEGISDIKDRVLKGSKLRLRPVILTAATDILGFAPMAFSTSAGAEVQRPLATVVIGGLLTSTLLTLIALPVLYYLFDEMKINLKKMKVSGAGIFATIFLLVVPAAITAQPKDDEPLDLQQCLQIVLKNNAGLHSSELLIEEAEELRKTSFDPGRTMLFAGTEENNTRVEMDGINSYGVQQTIEFPTVYLARSNKNKQNVAVQKAAYHQQEFLLKKQVSQTYYHYQYLRQRLNLYWQLDSLYQNIALMSESKQAYGETGKLESITNRARAQEVAVLADQAALDLENSFQQLAGLLQIDETFTIADENLDKVTVMDTLATSMLPAMEYINSLHGYWKAQWQVEKNQWLPGLYLQYFLQEVDGQSGFMGYQLGLNFPLWFPARQGKIQAAKIKAESISAQKQNLHYQIDSRKNQLLAQLQKSDKYLDYYHNQGLAMADQLISIAEKSYRTGETGYLQYLQSLEQALRIKMSYLKNLNDYNQVSFELKYLQIPQN